MKFLFNGTALAAFLFLIAGALLELNSTPADSAPVDSTPASSTPSPPAVAAAPASPPGAAVPVATSKRMACQSAVQALQGQDRRDQMQLCMAQAHLDCLKQAIDQKIVGPQRKDFMKTCSG